MTPADLSPGEKLRQAGHIGAGLGALLVRPLGPGPVLVLVVAALVFNALVLPRWLGRRLRRPGEGEILWGPITYPVTVAALLVVHWRRPELAAAGWALLAAGDGAATWVGRRWGRRALPWNRDKSWAGSMAYASAGAAAALGILLGSASGAVTTATSLAAPLAVVLIATVAAAALAAAVESLRLPIDDNLLPPLLGSFVLWGILEACATRPDLVAADALQRLPVAVVVHLLLAGIAWRLAAVTRGAAALGGLLGVLFVWAVGWTGWLMLAALVGVGFGTTMAGRATKRSRGAPGGRRHAGQILAKGGVATVAVVLAGAGASWPLWIAAAAGALAAALADTVASEIGVLSRVRPRLLPRLRRVVPAGTPGAVSPLGTAVAGFAGSVPGVLGLLTGMLTWATAVAAAVAGFVATVLESLLAARPASTGRDPVAMNFLTTIAGALGAAVLAFLFP